MPISATNETIIIPTLFREDYSNELSNLGLKLTYFLRLSVNEIQESVPEQTVLTAEDYANAIKALPTEMSGFFTPIRAGEYLWKTTDMLLAQIIDALLQNPSAIIEYGKIQLGVSTAANSPVATV
jgi:hypothetical protein